MPAQMDNPLDGRGVADAEMAQALAEVGAQRRRVERLADALTSCIVRLEDLNEGDGPTAQHARAALRSIGR